MTINTLHTTQRGWHNSKLTNYVSRGHSWEANRSSTSQKIPRIYGIRIHNSPPPVPNLCQISPVPASISRIV